jgi:site-specific DNA-cytosine methylase
MRLKLRNAKRFLLLALYPANTMLICGAITLVLNGLFFGLRGRLMPGSVLYDVCFALITGVTASFFVTVVVELTGNYKSNKLAWQELQEYYSAVERFENMKQVHMGQTPSQRARKQAVDEFKAAGGIYEEDEDDRPKDLIRATWQLLPQLMPVLLATLENKKQFLTDDEIDTLRDIQMEYREIRFVVQQRVSDLLRYNVLNHPDRDFLKGTYPQNILDDMPDWVVKYMATQAGEAATERMVDQIMTDGFLLKQFMKDYHVSEAGLAHDEDREPEEEEDEEDTREEDDPADAWEMNEETFRAENKRMMEELAQREMPSDTRLLSQACRNIARSIDDLEKHIVKKPYVGELLQRDRRMATASMNNPFSRMAYQSTKEYLAERGRYAEKENPQSRL